MTTKSKNNMTAKQAIKIAKQKYYTEHGVSRLSRHCTTSVHSSYHGGNYILITNHEKGLTTEFHYNR